MRVTRSRELVAEGYRPSAVARVAQISRQAIYRIPKPRRAPAAPARPPACEVEAAIVAEAEANPTDGYRMVCAWARRRLGRPVNRKRVLRVMRERRLIQRRRPLQRRRRPGFFRVERPDQLWHLDMTSVWVAEHGWVYLMAAIDCCTREIVAWHLQTRCRANEAIALIERAAAERVIAPGTLTLGTDNGSAFTARAFKAVLSDLGIAHRRGGYRDPREPGVHRVLVRQAQGTLRLARGVRDARAGPAGDRRLRHELPPPAALAAELQHAARGRGDLERWRTDPPNPSGLNRQHRRGARQAHGIKAALEG